MIEEELLALEREAERRVREAGDREIEKYGPGSGRRASEAMDAPMLEAAAIRRMRQRLVDLRMGIEHQENLLRKTRRDPDLAIDVKRHREGQATARLADLTQRYKGLEAEAATTYFGGPAGRKSDGRRPGLLVPAKAERTPPWRQRGPEGALRPDLFFGGGVGAALGAAAVAKELQEQRRRRKRGGGGVFQPGGGRDPRLGNSPQFGVPARPGSTAEESPDAGEEMFPAEDPKPETESFPEEERGPTTLGTPVEDRKPDIEVFPIPEDAEPQILIFPDMSGELDRYMIQESRRGNDETRDHLDQVREWFLARYPDWRHVGGGRDRESGKQKPEYHLPGPGSVFVDEKGRGGDSRPGGKWADLTFESPNGEIVHIQTVDLDRNGNPTQRELDNAEAIRRATRGQVILIPKPNRKR